MGNSLRVNITFVISYMANIVYLGFKSQGLQGIQCHRLFDVYYNEILYKV